MWSLVFLLTVLIRHHLICMANEEKRGVNVEIKVKSDCGCCPGCQSCDCEKPKPPRLGVMTFNTWFYGRYVDDGFEKIVRSIAELVKKHGENTEWIIGLQEVVVMPPLGPLVIAQLQLNFGSLPVEQQVELIRTFNRLAIEGAEKLINALNEKTPKTWSYIINDVQIAALLGIKGALRTVILFTENVEMLNKHTAVGSRNIGGLFVWRNATIALWNVHFTAAPYSPHLVCQGATDEQIRQTENSTRLRELAALVADPNFILWTSMHDTVLMGDFNVPSHIDWDPTLNCNRHLACGPKADFQFRVPIILTNNGFVDLYRSIYPVVVVYPGFTWSPFYGKQTGEYWSPQDRIDMIWFKNNTSIPKTRALILDPENLPQVYDGVFWRTEDHIFVDVNQTAVQLLFGAHRKNQWPSDHSAIVATFKIYH